MATWHSKKFLNRGEAIVRAGATRMADVTMGFVSYSGASTDADGSHIFSSYVYNATHRFDVEYRFRRRWKVTARNISNPAEYVIETLGLDELIRQLTVFSIIQS